MIVPLFSWRPPAPVQAVVETAVVETLTALARIQPPAEPPPSVTTRERLARCGCTVRENWRPGGWIGRRVRLCPEALAGKSCAAVRGEE